MSDQANELKDKIITAIMSTRLCDMKDKLDEIITEFINKLSEGKDVATNLRNT